MKEYEYELEKWSGRKSRFTCPACKKPQEFVRYVNTNTGEYLSPDVGKCNRADKCGFHYTPSQYFSDNPQRKSDFAPTTVRQPPQHPKPVKEVGYIPREYLDRSLSDNSNLVRFLSTIFDPDTITRLRNDYFIGATKNKEVIYWQTDGRKIRTGKIMEYNPDTGKRVKDKPGINWVHSKLQKNGTLPDDFNLVQCLFGEHLLNRSPDKVVALVESEKTALIGAGMMPEYVWVACGGEQNFKADMCSALKSRKVLVYPDLGAYEDWSKKAIQIAKAVCCEMQVSAILEKRASDSDRKGGLDIADYLLRETINAPPPKAVPPPLTDEQKVLKHLGDRNPAIYTLIDALDLVSASTGKKINYFGQKSVIIH
jgi:hypothetical protein